ncbi:alpha/beta hydrolase [Phyllobacterium sp. 21LDTY02-6]|uniref:alpha/beta hydrolase n=1 Tax=Phyllobacterium sp. 21LDTY02-6 TaxID=2944903 RepID=UPI002020473F|nr:alpha/beta hydrolase [Phyllobacterium sp. 21LDTY02-6]MCO4319172.1 alpha/beta hydrolase [Phyllobacterium sp. 21LDTY02-6]
MLKLVATAAMAVTAFAGTAFASNEHVVNKGTPVPECRAHVNYDRNADLPGYLGSDGICHPFMPTNQLVPENYRGTDYYADEFTDAKIRQRWEECKKEEACAAAARKGAKGFAKIEDHDTGAVDKAGKIDPEGKVDLKDIRRPSYFGQSPYGEPIAKVEKRTYTVEFTVPRDSYERLHLRKTGDIKLRGWYIVGSEVGDQERRRALVIMNNGGSNEITAIDNPATEGVVKDPATGKYQAGEFPDGVSEEPGMRHWRGFIYALNEAGFDVLVTDRRGNGISGGLNGYNTAEQANDMFRELDQLEKGEGLRLLTPEGKTLSGEQAVNAIFNDASVTEMPVVLGGYSRGSYAAAWAMHKNFVENCNYDVSDAKCGPAIGNKNVKGAILYGPNAGGLGYRMGGHDMIEAALRTEFSTTYYVDSGVLANIGKWPALQIVKGTWDYVEGLEGSFDAYRRASGLKDIFVFNGPHQLSTQASDNMKLVGDRMAAFAKAAVLGRDAIAGTTAVNNLKELVLSAPDHWELTTTPAKTVQR